MIGWVVQADPINAVPESPAADSALAVAEAIGCDSGTAAYVVPGSGGYAFDRFFVDSTAAVNPSGGHVGTVHSDSFAVAATSVVADRLAVRVGFAFAATAADGSALVAPAATAVAFAPAVAASAVAAIAVVDSALAHPAVADVDSVIAVVEVAVGVVVADAIALVGLVPTGVAFVLVASAFGASLRWLRRRRMLHGWASGRQASAPCPCAVMPSRDGEWLVCPSRPHHAL